MEREKKTFQEPSFAFIIVRELTPIVIREALEEFLLEEKNGFWVKLHHIMANLTENEVNELINKRKNDLNSTLDDVDESNTQ